MADDSEAVLRRMLKEGTPPCNFAWDDDERAALNAAIAALASPGEAQREGWQRMTDEAKSIQSHHLGDHQGDVYHAMQHLATRYGCPDTRPLTQPIATPPPAGSASPVGGDAEWLADVRRCLEDVSTEMRARGRGDERFQRLIQRMPRPAAEALRDDAGAGEGVEMAKLRRYYEVTQHRIALAKMALLQNNPGTASLELARLSDDIDAALASAAQEGK